jgi:GT2 family glycosyltransferase
MLCKIGYIQKTGMFETSYFGYFDEIDLAYRLKELNNYKIVVTSKAIIWHNHYTKSKPGQRSVITLNII